MTAKLRWPNVAEQAREEAIAQAKKILAQMEPMKAALEEGKGISSTELAVRFSRMSDGCNKIIIELMRVGPQNFLE